MYDVAETSQSKYKEDQSGSAFANCERCINYPPKWWVGSFLCTLGSGVISSRKILHSIKATINYL